MAGLTRIERAGAIPQKLTDERASMLEAIAAAPEFEPHMVAQVGYRYAWEIAGKPYSFVVKDVVNLSRVTSAEFHGGNRHYFYDYREGVLVATNDPRKAKQVEPDPGPIVKVKTAAGGTIEVRPDEFLELVNKHKARKIRVLPTGRVR